MAMLMLGGDYWAAHTNAKCHDAKMPNTIASANMPTNAKCQRQFISAARIAKLASIHPTPNHPFTTR